MADVYGEGLSGRHANTARDYLDGQTVVLFLICSILMTLYPLVLSFSESYRTFFRKIQN